jgi:hypothetical protein
MKRMNFTISERVEKMLREIAKERQIGLSEVIRTAVEEYAERRKACGS